MPWADLIQGAARALSLFNTITCLWLGLTVVLNAERRPLGTWLAGGGILVGGLFFALHTTVVGKDTDTLYTDLRPLWPYVWLLFLGPPYLTYGVITWYGGLFGSASQRAGLLAVGLVGLAILGASRAPGVLPTSDQILYPLPKDILTVSGMPVGMLIYPAYSALCFGLVLMVLQKPGTSTRFLGDVGRKRAHPWLVAAAALLLAISLGLGIVAFRYVDGVRSGWLNPFSPAAPTYLFRIDLLISALIAIVVVLVGKAVVSYEVFTGKVLPRGGLRRYWHNGLILAAGYGLLIGTSLGVRIDPIYQLMLATLLIAAFYALLSWRSYAEREQAMKRLRPFAAGSRLHDGLLHSTLSLEMDVEQPFAVLCAEILDARVAYLVPLGPLASILKGPLAYPRGTVVPHNLLGIAAEFSTSGSVAVPLDARRAAGAAWAVPLWSERGLIGALLLGGKRDGGPYVQEEFEVARATAERLMDLQANAELARRLMAVQRQRLAETQVIDRRTRRVLHDEVLPSLHTVLLALSRPDAGNGSMAEAAQSLAQCHRRIADLLREVPASAPDLERLGLLGALRQVVHSELKGAFEQVSWKVDHEAEKRFQSLSPLVAEVTYGAAREGLRNAARHARGGEAARPIHLTVSATCGDSLRLSGEDDGVGLGTTASVGGSGQGLVLHSAMMAVVGGTLAVEEVHGGGTRISLLLPPERSTL